MPYSIYKLWGIKTKEGIDYSKTPQADENKQLFSYKRAPRAERFGIEWVEVKKNMLFNRPPKYFVRYLRPQKPPYFSKSSNYFAVFSGELDEVKAYIAHQKVKAEVFIYKPLTPAEDATTSIRKNKIAGWNVCPIKEKETVNGAR